MKLFQKTDKSDEATRPIPLTTGQRVEIKIKGLGRTSGEVLATDGPSVLVSLVVNAGEDAAKLLDPDAVLEYAAERGVYSERGFARFDVNGTYAVRFVPTEEPKHEQRRDFARVDVVLPVKVKPSGGGVSESYDTLNVSANGMLIGPPRAGVSPLRSGMMMWIEIPLNDGQRPIEVRGTVVRETGKGAMGVRFDHVAESHQDRLVRFVNREQLARRRRGGD